MATVGDAEWQFQMWIRATEKAIKYTFKGMEYAIKEAQQWMQEIEKRCSDGLISEEKAYHEQMDLDSRVLDFQIKRAEERGILSRDDVLDLKAHMEELKGAKGVTASRQASFEMRDILNQYKKASLQLQKGVPAKLAYKDIKKAPAIAKTKALNFCKSIEQSLKRMQDQLREAAAERVR